MKLRTGIFILIMILTLSASQPVSGESLHLNRIDTSLYPTNFLNITITGEDDKTVEGLKPEDFIVTEEGRPQKVLEVAQSDEKGLPVYVVMVMDTSGSMLHAMEDAKKAGLAFLDYLSPDDRVAIVSFSDDSRTLNDFTGDGNILKNSLESLQPYGATALYSAVSSALEKFEGVKGVNKAVVVLADGLNNRDGSPDECRRLALKYGVPIFTIGLGDTVDKPVLSSLADDTGGIFRYAPTSSELEDIYKSLARQLKKQLWIKYNAVPQRWPKTVVRTTVRIGRIPGASETGLLYMVPVHWWKLITIYLVIELAIILLTVFLFRLLWKKMGFEPVKATWFSIFTMYFLTLFWYGFVFILFIPVIYFLIIGAVQFLLLIIPVRLMAR